ncbi:hypothetical protein RIF29_32218 [Crotalaria pallida]|uniref:Uncharacterized protein n=1 Tax=Crotalaria pallida TaxID=3830 RepID=A0AAN9HVN8_CROPI
MSAVVEVWVGELTKLREKVLSRKPLLSKASKEGKAEAEEEKESSAQNKNKSRDTSSSSSAMSEATMCLLMDRFVPW